MTIFRHWPTKCQACSGCYIFNARYFPEKRTFLLNMCSIIVILIWIRKSVSIDFSFEQKPRDENENCVFISTFSDDFFSAFPIFPKG